MKKWNLILIVFMVPFGCVTKNRPWIINYDFYRYLDPNEKGFDHPNTKSQVTITDSEITLLTTQDGKEIRLLFSILSEKTRDMGEGWNQIEFKAKHTDGSGLTGNFNIVLLRPDNNQLKKSVFAIVEGDGGQMLYSNERYN